MTVLALLTPPEGTRFWHLNKPFKPAEIEVRPGGDAHCQFIRMRAQGREWGPVFTIAASEIVRAYAERCDAPSPLSDHDKAMRLLRTALEDARKVDNGANGGESVVVALTEAIGLLGGGS